MDTNEAVFEKIKALRKDKYTMKDVDTICDLLGIELFPYQKALILLNLNREKFSKKIFLNCLTRR